MPRAKKRVKRSPLIIPIALLLVVVAFAIILMLAFGKIPTQEDKDKLYILKNLEECSRIKYMCKQGYQPFTDSIGCGCEKIKLEEEQFYCDASSRNADVCIQVYNPVCGWFNESIKCIKYPCAQNYGNSCEACKNTEVSFYTKGECPK